MIESDVAKLIKARGVWVLFFPNGGDINDGPGLDASEKRLYGSGIERLMGTVWNPDMCLRNALFETLSDDDRSDLDFSSLSTTSFKDPIINNVWHRAWIDYVLYFDTGNGQWVKDAKIWIDREEDSGFGRSTGTLQIISRLK